MLAGRRLPALVGRLGSHRAAPPTSLSARTTPSSLPSFRPSPSSLYPSLFLLNGHGLNLTLKRWATKKAAGVSSNNRKANPKYLGIKKGHGELVIKGNIILKQRGTEFHPKGDGIAMGKDHTLWAKIDGRVKFSRVRLPRPRRFVSVVPHERAAEAFPLLRLPKVPPKVSPLSKRARKRIAFEDKQVPREASMPVGPLLTDTARAALSAEAEKAAKVQPAAVHA